MRNYHIQYLKIKTVLQIKKNYFSAPDHFFYYSTAPVPVFWSWSRRFWLQPERAVKKGAAPAPAPALACV